MCIICIELAKQAMSPSEARRALREMRVTLDTAHVAELEATLDQTEAAAAAPTGGAKTKP